MSKTQATSSISKCGPVGIYNPGPVTLIMSANLCFTVMDGTAQFMMAKGLSPLQVAFLRLVGLNDDNIVRSITMVTVLMEVSFQFFGFIICISYFLSVDTRPLVKLFSSSSGWVWLRAVENSTNLGFTYFSVANLDLATFITLFNLKPFVVAFLCWIFLGERVTKIQIIACRELDQPTKRVDNMLTNFSHILPSQHSRRAAPLAIPNLGSRHRRYLEHRAPYEHACRARLHLYNRRHRIDRL